MSLHPGDKLFGFEALSFCLYNVLFSILDDSVLKFELELTNTEMASENISLYEIHIKYY